MVRAEVATVVTLSMVVGFGGIGTTAVAAMVAAAVADKTRLP